jgi:leucyl aminopeptidase
VQIRVAESSPRGTARVRIAFLHESRDPSIGAADSIRESIRAACRRAGFRGRWRETARGSAGRDSWILVGLGRAPASLFRVRRAVRTAIKDALRFSSDRLLIAFGAGIEPAALRALLPFLAQSDYAFSRYKSSPRGAGKPRSAELIPPAGAETSDLRRRATEAVVLSRAAAWARDLGNTPANDLGPEEFAREARRLAGSSIRITALDKAEIEGERMGGLLAVNSGSVRPPVFLIGEYTPPKSRGTAVLVGKGITFDSGGISIKPAPSMGEMKYDMMGAATAFACLAAARDLELPVRVVALAPLTENLPSGSACRPGDILRMRNGKTVEVDNTDAEGRLVLADALSYAEKFDPDVLVDYATLTGACLVALGHECAGLMTPDDALADELMRAGAATGERLWRLPLWDDYRENLKSEWADMRNTGGRNAGTVNAAVFLKEFVPAGVPWAHLDIAGVAHLEKEHGGYDAGATGFGIALTLEFLESRFRADANASKRPPSAAGRARKPGRRRRARRAGV